MSTHYDAVVIGSGQSGTPLATALAKIGRKTALVESSHIGGSCINVGCTPTKTMIASGKVAYWARRSTDYGVEGQDGGNVGFRVNMEKVRQRKRDIVNSFRGGSESRIKNSDVDLLMGIASFKDAKSIVVKQNSGTEKVITSTQIFINTGERPAKPNIHGLDKVPAELVLDSTSVMELGEVPSHLFVVGGGYIGLEFGQLFRRLGAEVTVVQRGKQLVPREDEEIGNEVFNILQEDGMNIHLNSSPTEIGWDSSSKLPISVTISSSKEQSSVTTKCSHILFAAGRVPNTDMLNLEAAGIKTTQKGHIVTNELLETNVEGIYALGDVKGGPAFTHVSYDDFRILQANLIDKSTTRAITDRVIPYVVYTDPQLGHCGLHEAEARAKYPDRKIQVASMPMEYVARALETDEKRGMMKAVVDADSEQILGFTCLGLEGGEIMSIVQTAMLGGLSYKKLQNAVYAHPTLAESLNNLWGNLK